MSTSPSQPGERPTGAGLKGRALEELRNYAVVAGYLYVCFSAILIYKSAVLHTVGISFSLHGIALVKALVIGKFILLGEAAQLSSKVTTRNLLWSIAVSVVLFFLLLVALSTVEEVLAGWVHGRSLAQTWGDLMGKESLFEMLSHCVLMLLVLVPLIAVKEFRRTLGADEFWRLLQKSPRS